MNTRLKIQDIFREITSFKIQYPITKEYIDFTDPIQREYVLTVNELYFVVTACMMDPVKDVAKSLTEFLNKRLNRVNKGNAAPWILPQSPANLLCDKISTMLAASFYSYTPRSGRKMTELKSNALRYYIPLLKADSSQVTGNIFADLRPWEWILGEDGYPIEIQPCLVHARKTGKLIATCKVEGVQRELSLEEVALVTQHSAAAKTFVSSLDSSDENQKDFLQAGFIKAFKNEYYVITADYGEESVNRLNLNCYTDFLNQFQDLGDWRVLLQTTDPEILKKATLHDKKSIDEITVKDLGSSDAQARGTLLGLAEIHRRELEMRTQEYSGPTLLNKGLGISKSKKLKAIEIFQDFLRSSTPLSGLDQYLIDNKLEEYREALYDSRLFWNSTLCKIVTLATKWRSLVLDQDFEHSEAVEALEEEIKAEMAPPQQAEFTPTLPQEKPKEANNAPDESAKPAVKQTYLSAALNYFAPAEKKTAEVNPPPPPRPQ